VVALQKVEEATAAALLIMDETAEMPQQQKEALELARLKVEKAAEVALKMVEVNAEMPQKEKVLCSSSACSGWDGFTLLRANSA
jgi:hypothetical protein